MKAATPREVIPTTAATRYEVVLTGPNVPEPIAVGFSARRTNRAILAVARIRGEEIVELLGDEADADAALAGRVLAIGRYRIEFSGRTEREVRTLSREAVR